MAKRTSPKITTSTPIGPDVDLDHDDIGLKDGTRLTLQTATEIIENVRRSTGRPSLTGHATSSPQIAFRGATEHPRPRSRNGSSRRQDHLPTRPRGARSPGSGVLASTRAS
jgi:hypothetical protein